MTNLYTSIFKFNIPVDQFEIYYRHIKRIIGKLMNMFAKHKQNKITLTPELFRIQILLLSLPRIRRIN